MKEIINSKGIISFFVFIIAIGFISTDNINNMEESKINSQTVVMSENL